MSPTPTVCAVMLTADRPKLARLAIRSFLAQTYPAKRLYIFDTGIIPAVEALPDGFPDLGIYYHRSTPLDNRATGVLRNDANMWACIGERMTIPDILIHWDDDDWSHPNRIAEQVALLQASGAEAVGYREMLFWREAPSCTCPADEAAPRDGCPADLPGEAWLYSSGDTRYCLGTSLCYWRETWERKPFEATGRGEDWRWLSGIRSMGVGANYALIGTENESEPWNGSLLWAPNGQPRMIARIHPGNARNYDAADMLRSEKQGGEWKRVPAWDAHCRAVMA